MKRVLALGVAMLAMLMMASVAEAQCGGGGGGGGGTPPGGGGGGGGSPNNRVQNQGLATLAPPPPVAVSYGSGSTIGSVPYAQVGSSGYARRGRRHEGSGAASARRLENEARRERTRDRLAGREVAPVDQRVDRYLELAAEAEASGKLKVAQAYYLLAHRAS